ncbi:hypothetical protein [Novosphingobium sp.]|uniref:hypothetical protein n=1 Tax=Novosphingobium sp. TaxID=1874826 RepID=UPI0038BAE4B6
MLIVWLSRILLLVSVLLAVRKGDEPERLVAGILFATFALDAGNHAAFGNVEWFSVNPGHAVIDIWAFVTLLWVALRANRGWPLLACAAQGVVLTGHLAKFIDGQMVRKAYWTITQLPFLLQVLALALGTVAHIQRRQRAGRYHAWRLD